MRSYTYIKNFYGYGYTHSKLFSQSKGFKSDFFLKKSDLQNLEIEDKINLKLEKKINIEFLEKLQNYKGKRHLSNLPVNGQRTKTNAKTRKKFKIT